MSNINFDTHVNKVVTKGSQLLDFIYRNSKDFIYFFILKGEDEIKENPLVNTNKKITREYWEQ